jgi:KDO2-lipid IV(A) lauroyltransferase
MYFFLFAFTWMVSLIPFWILYRISDVLYLIIFYLAHYRKATVYRNLRNSFPQKSDTEIDHIARAFYRHFCDLILESAKSIRISAMDLDKRMKFLNPEVFTELARENRNFALVSAHYGNWEWLINLPLKFNHKLLVIYRPLKSKPVDRLTLYMRSRHDPLMVPMESIYRQGLKYTAEKQLFCVWFIADQRPPRTSRFWTRFLNQETPFFEGIEKISAKLGLAVVFMEIQKVRRGYNEVSLKKLFDNAAECRDHEVTLACIREIEEEILRKPEYWLWSHKRFKHARPEDVNLITP